MLRKPQPAYFISRQFGPAFKSTTSGTASSCTFSIAFANQRPQTVEFVMRGFKQKFVVHLQDHLCFELLLRELARDRDHGELDQVGRGSLQRSVERGAFREIPQVELRGSNFRHWTDASEQRARHAGLARFGQRAFEIFLHAAIAREISGDELRGFFLVDARAAPRGRTAFVRK